MFLSMVKYTFTNLMEKSSDEILKKESCDYAYNTLIQVNNEIELSKDEKIDYLNVLKDLLNQIIEYYEKHTISTLDMKKQLESIQNEIDRLCKK